MSDTRGRRPFSNETKRRSPFDAVDFGDLAAACAMDESYGPLGILGGGQLGRMLCLAAHRLGIKTVIVDPGGIESPAGQVTRAAVHGSFKDPEALEQLAARCKVVTYEIEHINVDALDKIAKSNPALRIEPPPSTLRIIQDKYAQKVHLTSVGGVPIGDFRPVEDEEGVLRCGADWGFPLMLKAKRNAYDGRGNAVVKDRASVREALESLGAGRPGGAEVYAERWVPFERELAVVVARSSDGGLAAYPVVHTVQKLSMCHTTVTPANSALPAGVNWAAVEAEASRVAQAVVAALPGCGVFGVELFMTAAGQVLFNEVAPRVHNSGHYTQDACACDQFENHVRAVLGMPLGSTELVVGASAMLNLVGGPVDAPGGSMAHCSRPMERALTLPRASIHWYGKAEAKPQRKMGHINVTGDSVADVLRAVRVLDGDELSDALPSPVVGVIMGSDSDLPCMKEAAKVSAGARAASAARAGGALARALARARARRAARGEACSAATGAALCACERPPRALRPGPRASPHHDGPLPPPRARTRAQILKHFAVPFEVTIVSAHRTPDRLVTYAKEALGRGLKVIIAGAGGAAHLPGMVAAMTPLPVVGVPVKTSTLSGARSGPRRQRRGAGPPRHAEPSVATLRAPAGTPLGAILSTRPGPQPAASAPAPGWARARRQRLAPLHCADAKGCARRDRCDRQRGQCRFARGAHARPRPARAARRDVQVYARAGGGGAQQGRKARGAGLGRV